MSQKAVVLRVPVLPTPMTAIYDELLGFGSGNGDGVAKHFDDVVAKQWGEDHLVWLYPQEPEAKFDCLHSLYGEVMKEQSTFVTLLAAHGLFCLAAHLKQVEHPALKSFTGIVHAFNGSRLAEKMGMNHQAEAPWTGYDLSTPVLFLEQGRPHSIYTMWHSGGTEDTSLIAFCGSASMFKLEEETARLAA